MPSYTGDGATGVTYPCRDVDAESCWRQCCQVMLAMVLELKVVLVVVRLCSPQDQSIEVLSHREEVGYLC
jgi:uncharacterized protein YpmS